MSTRGLRTLVGVSLVSLAAATSVAWGRPVLYVDRSATGALNGSTWADAYTELYAALAIAPAGADVWVAAGTYKPASPGGSRDSFFPLNDDVHVFGGFPPGGGDGSFLARDPVTHVTILSGDLNGDDGPDFTNQGENSYSVVQPLASQTEAALSGFTIVGGNANGVGLQAAGGGMQAYLSIFTVADCRFIGNKADFGGAVYVVSCEAKFFNCIFSSNSASGPSAIGGAIYFVQSPLVRMANCLIAGNHAESLAGGVYLAGDGDMQLTNCTIAGNTAKRGTGVMFDYGSSAILTNCIIWGNRSPIGIPNVPVVDTGGAGSIRFSIIEGGWAGFGSHNSADDPRFVRNPDPEIGDLGDLHIACSSPAHNFGVNKALPPDSLDMDNDGNTTELLPFDLDHQARVQESTVDSGAYEGGQQSLQVSAESLSVAEGGTVSFGVALGCPPPANATVTLAISGDPSITIQSSKTLTFTAADYSTQQTVVVAAAEDANLLGGKATIQVSSAGILAKSIAIRLGDNDVPATLYVDAAATGANTGTSWQNAFMDLQGALVLAAGGTPIPRAVWIAAGTYKPASAGGDRGASFTLSGSISIYGGFPHGGGDGTFAARRPDVYATTLSGDLNGDDTGSHQDPSRADNTRHVLTASGVENTVVLDGLSVTSGYADGPHDERGGGLIALAGSPVIHNCRFVNNTASDPAGNAVGGGIYVSNGSPAITDCRFLNNATTGHGGGMGSENGGSPTFANCVFENNIAEGNTYNSYGGGLFLDNPNVTLTDCQFVNNHGDYDGGGIDNNGAATQLVRCTFTGNTAGTENLPGYGGGMGSYGLGAVLTDCAFTNNTVNADGGGLESYSDGTVLTRCRFEGNSALSGDGLGFGGGVYSHEIGATFRDCTFTGNRVDYYGGGLAIEGTGVMVTGCRFAGNSAVGNQGLGSGGGLANYVTGIATVTQCIFEANTADCCGAGADDSTEGSTYMDSQFIGNAVSNPTSNGYGGGGLEVYQSTQAAVINCIFSGNRLEAASSLGGGIYVESSSLTLINATLAGNTSSNRGGGLAMLTSTATIANSILWENTDSVGSAAQAQIYTADGATVTYSCIQGAWSGTGNIAAPPLFVNAIGPDGVRGTADDDLRLQAGSPCIDAGDSTAVPPDALDLDGDGNVTEPLPFDMAGHVRILDDPATPGTGVSLPLFAGQIVDLGAYEFVPGIPADLDRDGDVDSNLPGSDDLDLFQACFTGPAITYLGGHLPAGCALPPDGSGFIAADLDRDGDVDQEDFGRFQRCISGANRPASPSCAP